LHRGRTVSFNDGMVDGGFSFGLLVSAFLFGFRHGIDWDHLAAIMDITSSQDDRRQSMLYGTLYVLGHALVVLALGVIAIIAGDRLPASVDEVMTRIVGVTLLLLGVYVFVSLARHGRDFRLRSRWMLVFAGVRRAARWTRERVAAGGARRAAPVAEDADPAALHHGHHGQPGHHHHAPKEGHDEVGTYGKGSAFGVGMIHGVGAETPTQVLIFLAAAGAGGAAVGLWVLLAFIVGLVVANSVITFGSAMGFLHASKNWPIYATVAVVTGAFSLVLGVLFLVNRADVLPAFFGG
jgi:high-affinity nickel permease